MSREAIIVVANTMWYLNNFRVALMTALRSQDVPVIALAPGDETDAELRERGIRTVNVRMHRRGLNPLIDLATLAEIVAVYRRERPRVVFHNTIKPVIYGTLAARLTGVPTILNMIPGLGFVFTGDALERRFLRRGVEQLYRHVLSFSQTVFFQNRDDRDHFIARGLVDPSRTVVTDGSGVDLDHFSFAPVEQRTTGCVFLFVGRLLRDKGLGEFVEASRRLRERYPEASCRILGAIDDGNPTGISRAELDRWTHAGIVEYLGTAADVRPALRDADVVVLPSYREGVPRALLEAMAVGRAIITTDAPGCREVVVEGRNGLLVPPGDVDALVGAMSSLVRRPAQRVSMGHEGRAIAIRRFDVNLVNKQIISHMNLTPPAAASA